jgi:hypothetical protein
MGRSVSTAAHRITAPSPATRGRVVIAAVATGAVVAAGQTMDRAALALSDDATLMASAQDAQTGTGPTGTGPTGIGPTGIGLGGPASAPEYLPVARPTDPATVQAVQAMMKGQRLHDERLAREAEAHRV